MKDELGEELITKFAVLRPKAYNCFTDDTDENKKGGTKKYVIK